MKLQSVKHQELQILHTVTPNHQRIPHTVVSENNTILQGNAHIDLLVN